MEFNETYYVIYQWWYGDRHSEPGWVKVATRRKLTHPRQVSQKIEAMKARGWNKFKIIKHEAKEVKYDQITDIC